MANLSNINNRFLVTTGGNVGIGNTSPTLSTLTVGIGSTNSPSQICQLAGSGSGVYSVLSLTNTNGTAADNNGVGLDFHVNAAYSATGRIQLIHPTAQSGTTTNSSMQFLTYGTVSGVTTFSPRMTIDYIGNVGIGTVSPDATLDVHAPSTTAPSLTMGAAAGQIFKNEDSELAFGLMNASPYNVWMQSRFNGNVSRPLLINPLGGNVGIGTSSPRGILDISKIDGPELFLTRNDGNVAPDDLIGSLTFYNEDSDGPHRSSWVRGYATETFGRKGYLSFATAGVNSTDATEKMRITSSGQVGIGGTPQTTFADAITIETGASGIIYSEKAATQYNSMSIGSNWYYDTTNSRVEYKNAVVPGATNYLQYRGEHFFRTAVAPTAANDPITWSDRLVILNSGNVGIGTTNPSNGKFVINQNSSAASFGGNVCQLFENFNTTDGQMMSIGFRNNNSVGTTALIDAVAYDQSIGATDIRFSTYSGSAWNGNMVTFQHTGRVGIGTTSPQTNLHINNDTSNSYGTLRLEGSNRGGIIEMYNATYPVSKIQTDQSGNIGIYTSGAFAGSTLTEKLAITTLGNVAIGGTLGTDSQFRVELKPSGTILAGLRIGYNATSNNYYDADTHHFRLGTGSSAGGNLYVGGGVYLGGTAAANKLANYEIGDWTPVIAHNDGTGVVPLNVAAARYVRVGELVYVSAYLTAINPNGNAGGSGAYYGIRGFPFVPENYGAWQIVYASTGITAYGGYSGAASLYFMSNGTNGQRSQGHVNGAGVNAWGSSVTLMMNCVYNING
tara:strand:- start:225 stop:2579 length:2355 start_codon:yes stop_codon:yes gene_type:complete